MNNLEIPVTPPSESRDVHFSPLRAKDIILNPGEETPFRSDELVAFIKEKGISPSEWIVEQIKQGARIIGIGVAHKHEEIDLSFLDILKSVQEKSGVPIGELAIESDIDFQGEVDAYLRGEGELSSEAIHLHTDEFRKVMEYAKEKGIKVICVDNGLDDAHRAKSRLVDRDANMHERVNKLHQSHPDRLTIWSVGGAHLDQYYGLAPRLDRVVLAENPKFLTVRHEIVYSTGDISNPLLISSNMDERFKRTPRLGFTVEQTKTFVAQYYGNSDATIFMSQKPEFVLKFDPKTSEDFWRNIKINH